MVESAPKQEDFTMTQVHKRFTAEQVKILLHGYCQGNLSRPDVEEMLGIGKTRFFALLKSYRRDPQAFSVDYQRSTHARLSEEAENQIKHELLRDKALIDDPELPIHDYNYAALVDNVWNAMVIWREIQADGYTGEVSLVRRYIGPKRVLRSSRATVRFETEPGEQMQTDWGEVIVEMAQQLVKAHFIVNTLGYSRRFHFWCCDRQDAEHTYEGMILSFEYFGGVTKEVLVDNQKSAVARASNQGKPQFNSRFLDLAGWYGFTPRACRPYRAQTKGKDERMVGYIKQNFFARYRSFESWAHLNQLAERWLAEEADQRIHGTVKEVVIERFNREKLVLNPLPQQRYDTSYRELRQGAWDGFIDVRGNRYSVPDHLCGQMVEIRINLDGCLGSMTPKIRTRTSCRSPYTPCAVSKKAGW
jgi:transposase